MLAARLVGLALVLTACSSGREDRHARPFVLRVSTHFGVSQVGPTVRETMTSNLLGLVYAPLSQHFEAVEAEGNRLRLKRQPDSPLDSGTLAAALRHPQLVAARPIADGVEVVLDSAEAARAVSVDSTLLEVGPYAPGELAGDRLALPRRVKGGGPDRIEVLSMPTEEEEWRRLLGREVDLVPFASPAHLRRLREVPSIRVQPLAHPATVALWFHVSAAPTSELRLRRAVALALRRRNLAEAIGGDPGAAAEVPEDEAAARALLAGETPRLRLFVYDGSSELQRVALAIQQQLGATGIRVEIETGDLARLRQVFDGDFDLLLFFGGSEPRYWACVTSGKPQNFSGYSNPEFDRAVADGDTARARALLEHDIPLTPLYTVDEGIAMDRRLCGARPEYVYDLSWLAAVHPCAPGEVE